MLNLRNVGMVTGRPSAGIASVATAFTHPLAPEAGDPTAPVDTPAPVETSPASTPPPTEAPRTVLSAEAIRRISERVPFDFRPLPAAPSPAPARTATELARGAVTLLDRLDRGVVAEALQTVENVGVNGNALMQYLERKVRVSEVLSNFAATWSDPTKADFAAAFRMEVNRLEAMDAIVSVAILSDPDLETELRRENTRVPGPNDFLEQRRILYQWPPAGTPLEPPYLMLVVVEAEDVSATQDAVQAILGQLDFLRTFRLPRTVVAKLG
jgi:hypothetical protein